MDKKDLTQDKNSFAKNKALIVILGIIILLIFYFIIKLIPTNIEEVKTVNEQKQETISGFEFKKQGSLTFISAEGNVLSNIDIELADTEYKRMQGLMYRKSMELNQGMLFIFPIESNQSFWMKNTIISLDIIYVNVSKKIVKIHKNTTPFTTDSYPSDAPAMYVVEVIAGYTDKFNIKEGDLINWSIL